MDWPAARRAARDVRALSDAELHALYAAALAEQSRRRFARFARAFDAAQDAIVEQLGTWESMRLALTNPTFLNKVCARVRDLQDPEDGWDIHYSHVVAIVRRCTNLQKITLHSRDLVCDEVMSAITAYSASLRSLEMLNWDFPEIPGQLTDSAIAAVARVHTDLVCLCLGGQPNLADGALHSINLPKLESLDLHSCRGISDSGMAPLMLRCTTLKTLDLGSTRIADATVSAVAMNCPNLICLSLNGSAVTDESVLTLAQRCPNIRLLALENTSVTDESAIALAHGCPRLGVLYLAKTSITSAALVALGSSECPLHQTYIHRCPHVTDAGVTAMLSKWRKVPMSLGGRTLELGLIGTGVTVASVLAIAASLPNLGTLNVENTPCALTDEAADALARGCPDLDEVWYDESIAQVSPATRRAHGFLCPQ